MLGEIANGLIAAANGACISIDHLLVKRILNMSVENALFKFITITIIWSQTGLSMML